MTIDGISGDDELEMRLDAAKVTIMHLTEKVLHGSLDEVGLLRECMELDSDEAKVALSAAIYVLATKIKESNNG